MTQEDDMGAAERSEELGGEADDLEKRTERLEEEIKATGQEWEAKKEDASVPGAQPGDEEADAGGGGSLPPRQLDAEAGVEADQ